MKKLVSSLFAVIVMLFGGIFLTACNGVSITANFSQTQITLQIGEKLDPFTLIEEDLSSEEKEAVDFRTSKSSVAYIDAQKRLVAVSAGTASLYAVSGETTLASCTVVVPQPPINLSVPAGLQYNADMGKITWNGVYYSLGADVFLVPSYVLEVKKDSGEFVKHDIENSTEFLIEDNGEYTVRVQAKAPSSAFTSSDFTADYTFKIMSAPTDLAFDIDTQTLSWSHNGNLDTTTYKVKYLIAGQVQKELTATTNSIVIPDTLGSGSHTFQVETVPTQNDTFKNVSMPLVVEKLSKLSVIFDNGTVSWTAQEKASQYKVVVYLDGDKVGETLTTETSSTLPKLLASTPSNKYTVTVQALGNSENFIFDGAVSSEYQFEKLPKAVVKFNTVAKTFEIVNANLGKPTLVISGTQGEDSIGGEVDSVLWNVTSNVSYKLSAQILTKTPAQEIDGDISETFKADGEGQELNTIRNLADFSIWYQEQGGRAFVKYLDEREENGIFVLRKNNVVLDLTPNFNAYEVGEVATMFNENTSIEFEVERTKSPVGQTYFVGNTQKLSVQKIPAPTVLNYEDGAISVDIPADVEIAKIEYLVNDIETALLDQSQSEWNIKVRFVAKTTSTNNSYFSSSASTIFQIKRLDNVANLAVDYATKTIVFDKVLNAKEYAISLGQQQIAQTENTYNFGDYIGEIKVQAIAETFEILTSTQIGYLNSFEEKVEIVKIGDILDLKLQKSPEGQVSAVWVAPSQTYQKTINYSVYLKYTAQDNPENSYDFVLMQAGLTQNTYTFNANQFDKVGQYEIKVQITSPNADFLITETAESEILTRFSAPTMLSRVDNELTVADYNPETMAGIKIEQEIDGVAGETLYPTEAKYTVNIQPGQTLKLKIAYIDSFVEEIRKYNLGSLASEFTIYKLGNLTKLEYTGMSMNQFQFYATPAETNENGQVPNYVEYTYYGVATNDTVYPTSTAYSREFSYSKQGDLGFTLYAKATTAPWLTISAGETQYLSSDEEISAKVYKENAATDVQLHTVNNGIVVSWKFETIDEYTLGQGGYLPAFNVRYINYQKQSENFTEVINEIAGKIKTTSAYGTGRTDPDGFYEFELKSDKFKEAGEYRISISAQTTGLTIASNSTNYVINKLGKISHLSIIDETTAQLVQEYGEELDLVGTQEVVANGAGITISGTMLDLTNISAGAEVSLEVYKKAQTEITEGTYYLDGDKTTFKLIKLQRQDLRLDLNTNNLTWSTVADLPQDISIEYVLKLSGNGIEAEHTRTEVGVNLDEIQILEALKFQPGVYDISIKTKVLPMTIVDESQAEGIKLGYLSSEFSANPQEVEKLADVQNFKAQQGANAGEVKFSWDATTNASGYKLYLTNASGQTTTLTTTETSLTYDAGFALGTTNVSIQAIGQGKISSERSQNIAVTLIASLSNLQVNYAGIVSWNPNLEIQSLTIGGFVVELYSILGEKKCEVSTENSLATSINLFEDEDAKTFIDSLNGEEFIVKVYVKGAVNEAGNAITLSSAVAETNVLKLFAPEIKIENNTVVITSTNTDVENLAYFVEISNGVYQVYGHWYINPIPIMDNGTYFEIKAYATVAESGVGAYGTLDSSITTVEVDKLGEVTGTSLSAELDQYRTQETVKLTWQALTDQEGNEIADGYEIYVSANGQESQTPFYIAQKAETEFTFPASTFQASGKYQVKMRAISAQNLYSNFTMPIDVVRLSPMKGAYMTQDAMLHFGQVAQNSQNYQIFAYLKDGANSIASVPTENFEKTAVETNAFMVYLNNTYQHGAFYVHVKYVGAKDLDNNTLTLSSDETVIAGYKLYKPTLTINPDRIFIDLTDNALANGQTVLSVAKTSLAVSKEGAVQKDDSGLDLLGFEGKELVYPNNWTAGEFEFNVIAAPKTGVFNVLPSATATLKTTRLAAPKDLGFKRSVLSVSELTNYSSDVEGFTDYLSSKLSFVFEEVLNSNGYILSNQFEQFGSLLSSGINDITIGSALEEFFYKAYVLGPDEEDPTNPEGTPGDENQQPDDPTGEGTLPDDEISGEEGSGEDITNPDGQPEQEPILFKEISLIALAPAGGAYINSQKANLTYTTLNAVESFFATGEGFSWNTTDSNVETFLIMAIYNQKQYYWQAEDASQRESTLANLQYEGNMSLNIKALGNVSILGTYENIVLDSQFLTHNKAFTKLREIQDLGTDKGFFKFQRIQGAENYSAQVYGATEEGLIDEDNLILETDLIDYTEMLKLVDEQYFVGYSPEIAMLNPADKFFIKIRAEAIGENILHANYSQPLKAKVLPDVNALSGLTLISNPENQLNHLDRKIINVKVADNASGLWIIEDDVFTAVPVAEGTSREYTFTPTVIKGGQKVLQFASYGTTSADQTQEHLLTSSFYQKHLNALERPAIALSGGVITWPTVMGADGYYVYINGNMIGSGMYLTTMLDLGNAYGGDVNTPITIEVVPVSVRDDGLWGPKATYNITQVILDTKEEFVNSSFVVKLHKPEGIKIYDGALLWSQGVVGLDGYNESALERLYEEMTQNLCKETIDAFDNAIEALFNSPITIYSKYSGFNQLVVQVTLSDGVGFYTFESDALTFITLTQTQRENLQSLVNYIPSRLDAFVKSLQETTAAGELLYDYTLPQNFDNITQYAISRLSLILNNFSVSNVQLQQLLNASNSVRFPSEDILFEELAGNVTAGLGYGSYTITISQRGNNADWLNSSLSDAQKVYVPMAPQNLKIVEENGNYHLVWDKITLETGLTYSANLAGEKSQEIVYALFGDNASGNRKLLSKTIGTPYSGQLSLSLTELIEEGILDSNITSIYLVAMGNATGDTDDTRILMGLRSQVLSVTVLPQVLAKVVDGELVIDPSTDGANQNEDSYVDKFEVSSHEGSAFETQIVSGTNVFNPEIFRAGTTYLVDVRFIGGDVTPGQQSFVLSGQKRTMRLEKLAPMDVSVNTYGNFVWQKVNNANGFILSVSDEDEVYIERDARVTSFEATTPGFKNYAFRALGTTANITNTVQTYYLNSEINNQKHGLDAVMLTAINRIFVEEGLIKWSALDTELLGNQTTVGEGQLVIGYKLSFSNEVAVFTTQLDSSVFTKDSAGNFCFDFTNFGEEGTHTVQIQAYAQVQKASLEIGTTVYEQTLFTQLMGQKFESAFTKIAPPSNIEIYNGQVSWQGSEEDKLYMYKITAQNQLITGETETTQVWREEVLPGTQYEFEVRAYQENMVFSSYAKYVDISTEQNDAIKFTKLKFDTPVASKTTEADGNYISFTVPDSAIDLAINLKYKADGDSEYSYLNYGDENYYNVISFTNNLVRINVTNLRDGIQSMEYYLQLVPLGTAPYLSSNFTDIDRYITPQALSIIYFDQTDKEYYFEALEHVGYSIRDQLFNEKGSLVATYYYSIPVQDHTAQNYYKQRDVNGAITPTINFTPVVTGYSHIVSVAVCASNVEAGQTALMSPYTTCTQDFRETLFAPEKDIFAEGSEIFSQTTTQGLSEYLKANAYGTSANAYVVDSAEKFENLNLRLTKYSYLSSYTVEIENLNVEKTLVEEDETTFVFKQTQNIEGVDTSIGHRTPGSLGSIKYTGFDNTYDGQGFTISYTLTPSEVNDKVALFRVLESNGVIKNLKVNATINYNGAGQVAGLVAENKGLIEKVTISALAVSGFTINASTLSTISFGAIACQNSGRVVNSVNDAEAINIVVRVNGVVVNVGGIVAQNDSSGTVSECGNNMKISVSAYQEARVGGIAGYNNGHITECYSSAQITAVCQNIGSMTYVGGIAGFNDTNARIEMAYVKGQIVAESEANNVYAGGIVGYTKNTNISYTYTAVSEIIIQRNTEGEAIKLGGTFVGYADTLTNSSNPNFYVYAPQFGREEDENLFLTQQIDITSYTAVSDLVGYMNEQLQENIFVYSNSDIHFVWENA